MWRALKPKRKGKKAKKRKVTERVRERERASAEKTTTKKKKKKEEEEGAGKERRWRSWAEKKEKKKKGRRRRRTEKAYGDYFFFFFPVIYWCRPKLVYQSKLVGMTETRRNEPKFFPRWNKGVSRSSLHTNTRFFDRNGTEYTTLIPIKKASHIILLFFLFPYL